MVNGPPGSTGGGGSGVADLPCESWSPCLQCLIRESLSLSVYICTSWWWWMGGCGHGIDYYANITGSYNYYDIRFIMGKGCGMRITGGTASRPPFFFSRVPFLPCV